MIRDILTCVAVLTGAAIISGGIAICAILTVPGWIGQ